MIDIITQKLRQYDATNALEEEHAVKEILQEIALYALWRGGFFDVALFQGGTSLRILHGLPRFPRISIFSCEPPTPISTGRLISRFSPRWPASSG